MRVGIIGGAGFIGSNLAESLFKLNHQVHIFDNFESGKRSNLGNLDVRIVEGDIKNREEIEKFILENNIETCFHLAAMGSVPRSILNPDASFNSNVIGSLNVLNAVKKHRLPIMYTSSSSVYGSNEKMPKSEDDWMSPISPYGAFKSSAEAIFQAYAHSYHLDVKIVRPFNVYGPKQNPEGAYAAVIPKWIIAAIKKEPLIVYGDGSQRRDFTFVDDVVKVFIESITNRNHDLRPLNLAFGDSVNLLEILEIFKSYFGKIKILFEPEREGDIKNSESDSSKFRKIYPMIRQTPIQEGLIKTFDWFTANHN